MDKIIKLYNQKKECVGDCLVSTEDYDELVKLNWNFDRKSGYVYRYFDKTLVRMHRYIQIELMKNKVDEKSQVMYKNSNKLDNRRENLIIGSKNDSYTKQKSSNRSSKYNYVSYHQTKKKWIAECNGMTAYYDNEIDAAFQVNIWVKRHKLDESKLNDVQEPDSFVEFQPKVKNDFPTGVSFSNNKFLARICYDGNDMKLGYFDTLEEAIQCRKEKEDEIKALEMEKIMSNPIKKNEKGECVIEVHKNKEVFEAIVDEDMYYTLQKYKWYIKQKGNIYRLEDKKNIFMWKHILDYDGDSGVEYINKDKFNNKKENLRLKN
jgi:hypothetical protein